MTSLIVGVLAFVGGFALEYFRRRSTDRRWLLDRRHEAYTGYLNKVSEFGRLADRARLAATAEDTDAAIGYLRTVQDSYYSVVLVGTDRAQWHAGHVWSHCVNVMEAIRKREDWSSAWEQLTIWHLRLAGDLRAELQPVNWWKRLQGRSIPLTSPTDPVPRRSR